MSIRFLNWAFHLLLPDMAAKGVLNALANHADENGRCWPSVATLALYTGCDERTAQRALGRLVTLGLVEREPRPGKSDVFILRMEADPSQNQPLSKMTPDSVTGDPGQRDPDPGHIVPRTIMNRQGTIRTRARESASSAPPPIRLPDTAKWAERLANFDAFGDRRWSPTRGPPPDSSGNDNPLIPPRLLAEWKAEHAQKLATLRAERGHEARQDGAMATPCATASGKSSSTPTDPRRAA